MPKTDRVTSGVKGLDKLLEGGFIPGSSVLVTGSAGTGKSTFLLQFMWDGLQNGESCLFITLEETPEELKADALQYGWDFAKYEKSGKFRIEYFDPFELGDMQQRLKDLIIVNNFSRVSIDSSSLIGMYENDEYKTRKKLYSLVQSLKKAKTTSLISAEIPEESKQLSRFGVEEFVVDGVIVFYYLGIGEGVFRSISVRKMRQTNHKHGTFPMEITPKGLVVREEESVL